MAVSINSLRRVRAVSPPRLTFYGPPGVGKTTLASEFPEPIFLQVEDGTPGDVELTTFGILKTYSDVMQAIGLIYDQKLPFRTVVLDSMTEMQRLIFAETCARGDEKGNIKQNIEDFGYGKGYVYAQRIVQELVEALNLLRTDRNMAIVMIAHSTVERFDDPESVSYDRYDIDLHGKIKGQIERDMDGIFLLKQKVSIEKEEVGFNKERALAKGGSQVWLHANPKPAYVAKNRYGIKDALYVRGKGFSSLEPFFPKFGEEVVADENESQRADAA